MFLSYSFLSQESISNVIPSRQPYHYLEVNNSNSSLTIDALHVLKFEDSNYNIFAHYNDASSALYDDNSVLVADFESSLEAGSIVTSVPYNLTNYIIRRKEVGDSLNTVLTKLDYDPYLKTYTDYTARNNCSYIYGIYPYFGDNLGNGIEGRGVEGSGIVSFDGWLLADITTNPAVQYKFNLNIESDNIEVVADYKLYNNYTQFPTIRFSNTEYRKGKLKTIPCIFNTSDNSYTIDQELLDDVINFINNKNEKILRLPSGEAMKVITTNASYKYYDEINEQPYTISFEFIQVAEV